MGKVGRAGADADCAEQTNSLAARAAAGTCKSEARGYECVVRVCAMEEDACAEEPQSLSLPCVCACACRKAVAAWEEEKAACSTWRRKQAYWYARSKIPQTLIGCRRRRGAKGSWKHRQRKV